MKCPNCLESFHDEQTQWHIGLGSDADGAWMLVRVTCPACRKFVFFLEVGSSFLTKMSGGHVQSINGIQAQGHVHATLQGISRTVMVHPKSVARTPLPKEVPEELSGDYKEACLILNDSPKASAALSRRCLQNLLRCAAGVKAGDLSSEIQQVLGSGQLPTAIAENVDAIRNIGNFAAHPAKSSTTGEVVPVEPHEAEWNLEVLELLFDFYFVQPARAKAKRDALNAKLADAKKPAMK